MGLPAVVFVQSFLKDGACCYLVEERHRGPELQNVGVAEDRLGAAPREVEREPGTRFQSQTQNRMLEIRLRFVQRPEGEPLGGTAQPEPRELGEDVPCPMAPLAPRPQLVCGRLTSTFLCGDQALQVIWVAYNSV